jgi:acetyltransferase
LVPEAAAGTGVQIRPARTADCVAISAFVAGLSPRARFLRFFGPASPPSSSVLRGMCGAGLTTDVLVATDGHGQGHDHDDRAIVGHAMAADSVAPDGALVTDVGLVIADRWQHHGVGSDLLGRLIVRAHARGVSVLTMDVLPENRPMLALIAHRWPGASYSFGSDAVTIRVNLTGPPGANGEHHGTTLRAA